MKTVNLRVRLPMTTISSAYAQLCDFNRYQTLCQSVRKITVDRLDDVTTLTNWEVDFQNGILKWKERDTFDPVNHRIHFEQTEGDIEHFSGAWHVHQQAQDSVIEFTSCFDLGMPMLSDMLDPVAEKAIHDNIHSILSGLFPLGVFEDAHS